MFGIGPMELVVILVVALLVLGPKRMPELARTLGRGLAEFRRASNELRQGLALDEIQNELRDGLRSAGGIRRPMKRPGIDDPPAQAGDDLPAGDGRTAPHPGELPDDADPHAHHDEPAETPDERVATPGAEARAARASAADSGLGSVPVGGRTPEGGVPAGGERAPSAERERG